MKLVILGGDKRQHILYELLEKDGHTVSKTPAYRDEIIIGPIPCSKDNKTLFQTTTDEPVIIEELFRKMNENQCRLFIAGAIKENILAMAEAYSIEAVDLMALDETAIMNAVPTAEGAVAAAMENSDITIFGSRCLVLGYGRCGKVLANMLKGIGAAVSVGADNAADEAYIKCYGFDYAGLDTLEIRLKEFDFIFNTIPVILLDRSAIRHIKPGCLVIDIASAPGGVDLTAAEQMGIFAVNLPGLPGKAAPRSAAIILKDIVCKLLIQRGLRHEM